MSANTGEFIRENFIQDFAVFVVSNGLSILVFVFPSILKVEDKQMCVFEFIVDNDLARADVPMDYV